ncbi:Spr Cell wall-associated hydrolases (invasion-associated proteins) [uncultured Caudovirales phage]|uniref:Spr Cell wall-associated hydrolases (Invasion-associated proteins) n=1 Tax=uncultured Caudovirales phage TaxID=2100421 RepID=A0A6J5L8B4_9CAUD|nr:Spr Cell wall-associated hydrolases (invasion-associated proteins) [uncultured Caudovirales phage]
MKKFIATVALLTTLAGCSASAEAATKEKASSKLATHVAEQTGIKSLLANTARVHNTQLINKTADRLKKYVGKTWYVFSGNTPNGWDCSGLVMWFYQQNGITLHHSAYAEKYTGRPHKYSEAKAKVGDIIAFPGHVGIYVGNGYMIHAPRPGTRTQRIKVWQWAKMNWTTDVTYTRLITTN